MNDVGILEQILKSYGPVGVVTVGLLLALRYVYRQLSETQEKRAEVQERRIADAQLSTVKLLELVASQHAHQALLAKAIDGNADAVQSLRELVASLAQSDRPAPRTGSLPRR